MEKGNFRIDNNGNIEFYVGWCQLEYQDIEDLRKILKKSDKINKKYERRKKNNGK